MTKIIITPDSKEQDYWTDVWQCRQIILILAWRDIVVRYKQSVIGVFWTLLKPSVTIAIFWLVSTVLNIDYKEVPHLVLVGSAVIPWQYVSSLFTDVSNSLVNNDHIIKKIYFPLIIIPFSSAVVSFVDFIISLILLTFIFAASGFCPSWHILMLPFFIVLGFLASFGLGLFFGASSVKYRDFRVLVPFITQIALYVSPVVFTSQLVYESKNIHALLKVLYSVNPFVCVIDGFRWCLADIPLHLNYFGVSLFSLFTILVISIFHFRSSERHFAEFI